MNANNSMPAKMTLVEMVTDLINLIKKEELLRRHHRAYLHVRDDIHECCDALTAYINSTMECIKPFSAYQTLEGPVD